MYYRLLSELRKSFRSGELMTCADCGAEIFVIHKATGMLLETDHTCPPPGHVALRSGLVAKELDEVELSGVTVFKANRMKRGE